MRRAAAVTGLALLLLSAACSGGGNHGSSFGRSSDVTRSPTSPSSSATSSPSPIPPSEFDFTMPNVVGMKLASAKQAVREAISSASGGSPSVTIAETFDLRFDFPVRKKESKEQPGTVLAIRGDWYPGKEMYLTPHEGTLPGQIVRVTVVLVVATVPVKFHGDSIYVGGQGTAMITWMDGNYSIHQATMSLPAWFRVPQGVENFSAQKNTGDSSEIVCEIRYNDKTYARSRSSGPYAICSVSS
jgi:hypothetical protein